MNLVLWLASFQLSNHTHLPNNSLTSHSKYFGCAAYSLCELSIFLSLSVVLLHGDKNFKVKQFMENMDLLLHGFHSG